ncbi:MAG: SH3 domain-containing protein [Saprospiraceae bacterium]|nr:SH3 domain-containing protein [Saprospiraceae bacterium]MCB9344656.1 SH3 domain-containing protein [Lewinellaceae bacterium]
MFPFNMQINPVHNSKLLIWSIPLAMLMCIAAPVYSIDHYCVGDTLNCLALNGLKLRDAPKGKQIATVALGEQVLILESKMYDYPDIYENIPGYWVKVRFQNLEGFVFDGYLSGMPAPTVQDSGLYRYLCRVSEFKSKPIEKSNSCPEGYGGGGNYGVKIQLFQGVNFTAKSIDYWGWEWGHTTVSYDYISFEEVLLICQVVKRSEMKGGSYSQTNREFIKYEEDEDGYYRLTIKEQGELDTEVIVLMEGGY